MPISTRLQDYLDEHLGSLVVTNSTGIRGLLTERDMMKHVVGKGKDPGKVKLRIRSLSIL